MPTDTEELRRLARFVWMQRDRQLLIECADEIDRLRARLAEVKWKESEMWGAYKSDIAEVIAERDAARSLAEEALRVLGDELKIHNVRGEDGPCDCSSCRFLARHDAALDQTREAK